MKTKIIEVIYTEERRGTGKENNPGRLVVQLWSKEGNLIVEKDPCGNMRSGYVDKDGNPSTEMCIVNTHNIEL